MVDRCRRNLDARPVTHAVSLGLMVIVALAIAGLFRIRRVR
jgi:hypothetical protein